VRPPQARRDKPRVSAFTSADIPKILALEPDLVLTFSDLQADIAAVLIRQGVAVHAFNQRTIAEILDMIRTLGALVGAADRAEALADRLAAAVDSTRQACFATAAPAKGLFRGMRRTDDFRHRLGLGAYWRRRRHRHFCRACLLQGGQGPNRLGGRNHQSRAGHHHWLVVRQEVSPLKGDEQAGFRAIAGGAARRCLRNQVAADPAAGAGGIDRWPRRTGKRHRPVSRCD
jgi:hypothetical protein